MKPTIAVEALQWALSRDPKLVNPRIAVETLQWLHSNDPTFSVGESHTAKATLTNQTDQALTCTTELYLDVMKVASSGVSSSFTMPAGGSIDVSYVVTMPSSAGGPYHVYIDVWSGGALLAHYQATEDVTIVGPLTAILRPNGVGVQTQHTPVGDSPNWKCVDEETPDEMATYVRSPLGTLSADRPIDLYTLSDFPESRPVIINWVRFWIRCYNWYAGIETYSMAIGGVHLRTQGTIYPRSDENADPYILWDSCGPTTGYGPRWVSGYKEFATNPYTGLPWTVAELNDLQAGAWLWGKTVYRYCTQVYVEVNYTLA